MLVELPAFWVAQNTRKGDLDRYFALGEGVNAEINGRRRTVADFAKQFVFADFFPSGESRAYRLTPARSRDRRQNLIWRRTAKM